jgi:hypothetical protein
VCEPLQRSVAMSFCLFVLGFLPCIMATCMDCMPPVCNCNGSAPCPLTISQPSCSSGSRHSLSFSHKCSYLGQFVGARAVVTLQVGSVADFTLLKVYSFDDLSFANYTQCQPFQAYESRVFSSCTGMLSLTSDSPDSTVVVECQDPSSCSLYWSGAGVCSQAHLSGLLLFGSFAIVCFSLVLVMAVVLAGVSLRNAAQYSGMLWFMLGLAIAMSVLCIAYWSLFLRLIYAAGVGVASSSMFVLDVAVIGIF